MTPSKLKRKRESMGMTQSEFAKLLGYKSYHSISEMERGKRVINKLVQMVVTQLKGV
jgi:transcriptional regulator with XRE-family HTH domain